MFNVTIRCRNLFFAFLAALSLSESFAGDVVISEVMHHPSSGNPKAQFVELLNVGTNTVDLSAWKFSKGIQFTFETNTVLKSGAFLVIAADRTNFTALYPTITNFVSGWSGWMGHELRLEDRNGGTVTELSFTTDGDWATRELGPVQYNHQGWTWAAAHDGGGSSLELINPHLPTDLAQNWSSSTSTNGTPGRANSISRTNIAPLIIGPSHSPLIPQPTDVVTIRARIIDERTNGTSVSVSYRNASTTNPPTFTLASMFDDGAHGDGLAGDGIYAAQLPPQPNGTVIEFFLQASDAEGNARTYPNFVQPTNSLRTANLLYQVDNGTYQGTQPIYRIIMTELERAELYAIGRKCPDSDSDAQMNATWITTDSTDGQQTRYNVGVRNRGHGTRQSNPDNYHINIPSDRLWKKQAGINLNSQYAYSQVLASAVFRRVGIPMPDSRTVQVRVNSTNIMSLAGLPDNNSFGSYAANEQYNADFVKRSWPLDPNGNSYRGIRDQVLCDASLNGVADLAWHGTNFAVSGYTNAYFLQNNYLSNDGSDIVDLIAVLNQTNGYQSSSYVADVQRRMNVDQWMKYMAVNTLIDNDETCLANGVGDDYALYRGVVDPRFVALPYDLDTVMGRGLTSVSPQHSLFRMTTLSTMDRFMKTAEFVPVYYAYLKELAETVFARDQMNALLDQTLGNYVPAANLKAMKDFNASQVAYVLSQIPLNLTVASALPIQSGYFRATTLSVSLSGQANVTKTRSIRVNGATAQWSAWQGTWTNTVANLKPGVNRITVESLDVTGHSFAQTNIDIWYDSGSSTNVGGTLVIDTVWNASKGPFVITNSLTVLNGVTLTIEPGTTVYLGSGVNLIVADGGRIVANGTLSAPIRFASVPGSGASWGGITLNGSVNSPETRFTYAFFEGNSTVCIEVAGGTLYLDHSSFGTTTHQYLALDGSSFLLSNCYFPSSTSPFELLHGTAGIKQGGRGIVRECFFGTTTGYNDVMDFTGGNRPNQPIIQFYNNVFAGGADDILDLDGTDAWIEGNIFMHCHRGSATPDSSSAVSGGNYDFGASGGGVQTSEITVIGNIFYDCDNASTAKEGNFFTFLNNTIVHTTKTGGVDSASGVVNVRDFPVGGSPTAFGKGFYLEGNIIHDAEDLVRNFDSQQATVTFNNNILPFPWNGLGASNVVIDPSFQHVPQLAETYFSNWEDAQVMREWFSLLPGSAGLGTGPNGRDKGGVIPYGVSISGEPIGTTYRNAATLTVGLLATGAGIPTTGFPFGSGFTHYKWSLDQGNYSAETPITTPIILTGLANGPHAVTVIGKNDAGYYQNDPALGPEGVLTQSCTWIVANSYSRLLINEVLAKNDSAVANGGTYPDMIELYNDSSTMRDISGMGITDDSSNHFKFTFPPGMTIGAGQYLVLYADSDATTSGLHLGFKIKQEGESLYLYESTSRGGQVIDSVSFGFQIPNLSIGRMADGSWALCQPTFGSANISQPMGDARLLKINEWLADARFQAKNDFVEIYNPSTLPVSLGGLYVSDAAGAPAKNVIPQLSYIPARGFSVLAADGDTNQGADHLNFKLSPDVGLVLLSSYLGTIDAVNYGPQSTDVSQGRVPDGGPDFAYFAQPTPGSGNSASTPGATNIISKSVNLLPMGASWKYNQRDNLNGINWTAIDYDDSVARWSNAAPALLYSSKNPGNITAAPLKTQLILTNSSGSDIPTYYFRTKFVVSSNLDGASFAVTTVLDDGAIIYLNGREILRVGMPTGTVTYTNYALRTVTDAAAETFTLTLTNLVQGTNVLAAEVHNVNATSSDICWGMALDATFTTTNIISSSQVIINEVLANNHARTNFNGFTSDWIELFNPATNAVDLADMSLSNDPSNPRKWIFPTNSMISPNGYLLVYFENSLPPATNNTGFKLRAGGDSIFLFDKLAKGGSRVDGVNFGIQAADFSLGRVANLNGGWALGVPTPGSVNVAAGLGAVLNLRINEWLASNSHGNDWFEIFNSGTQPVSLDGLFLTSDLNNPTLSPIAPLSFIGVGSGAYVQFQADKQLDAGPDHANFNLSKSGDSIGIYSAAGLLIDAVTFGAQQTDVSQGRFPDGAATVASFATTPSPGAANYLPVPNLVINELLSHTDPPLEDAIEFFNSGATDLNIGGWYLSNSSDDLKKYRVPAGTVVPARGFKVFYEYQFNPTNSSGVPFTFNSAHGDSAYLSQADGLANLSGYRAAVSFGPAANGISFGKYTKSIGVIDFVAMTRRSFGVDNPSSLTEFRTGGGIANSLPLVGPIVINEIQLPPSSGSASADFEFMELLNTTAATVPLYDPAAPTNTWKIKGGVDFTFPRNSSLPAGAFVLVVPFDLLAEPAALAAFRTYYQLNSNVTVMGPYSGHLSVTGETVALYRPDPPQLPPHPDAGFVPYVLVDRIDYSTSNPWPLGADGASKSLQRKVGTAYGNDPANWFVGTVTAARANGAASASDSDGDGLPDSWEIHFFGSINDPRATPGADPDGDGFNNLQEYLAGTNPLDAKSYLRLDAARSANGLSLRFNAVAGISYSVLYRDDLVNGAWLKLADIPASSISGELTLNDPSPATGTKRFYQLVTPKLP